MKTCDGHDNCVVVYDKYNCPICELENLVESLNDEIEQLKSEIVELRDEMDEIREKNDNK